MQRPSKDCKFPLVMGLDLSITSPGLALLDMNGKVVHLDGLKTRSKDGDKRLNEIARWIGETVLEAHYANSGIGAGLSLVIIEDLPVNARMAGRTGMVQGVARAQLNKQKIPYALVVASTLKKFATGKGSVPKEAKTAKERKEPMLQAFEREFGYRNEQNDEVDAALLALMGVKALQGETHLHGIKDLAEKVGKL